MIHTHAHLKEYPYTHSHPHTYMKVLGRKKVWRCISKTFTEICLSVHEGLNMGTEHGNAWTPFINVLRKKKQVGFFEFKASLVSIMSSKLYGATLFNSIKCEPVNRTNCWRLVAELLVTQIPGKGGICCGFIPSGKPTRLQWMVPHLWLFQLTWC